MKHSEHTYTHSLHPAALVWILPVLLIVPNVVFAFTEQTTVLSKATDIVLPLGLYFLLSACSTRVGRTTLLSLPVMILAAFQIVLLYLYGESIIAIDMFLNVATTNVGEVSELLGNLTPAIIVILAIYLPPFIWAVLLLCCGGCAAAASLRLPRRIGAVLTGAGVVMLAACYAAVPGFALHREIFPVNVCYNMCAAIGRTAATARYHDTSADFRPMCRSSRPDSAREVYVVVVGETSRADNWQLLGYDRPTSPRLDARDGLTVYPRAISESNTTHKSVPMLLSHLDASDFGDSIYSVKSIIASFADAGYATAFFSNQQRNHSFIDFFGEEADTCVFIKDDGKAHHDMELIERLRGFVAASHAPKQFVVLHTYGSHFNYRERYTDSYNVFRPSDNTEADKYNRPTLINAYDNTIVYTDALLDSIASSLTSLGCHAAMVYTSDHGEDIYDDSRERFLHASPTPTYYQLHVPLLLWMSPQFISSHPDMYREARRHTPLNVSSSRSLYNTAIHMAGLVTPHYNASEALTSPSYAEPERLYLNDYNEGVPLRRAGLREPDRKVFRLKGISLDK